MRFLYCFVLSSMKYLNNTKHYKSITTTKDIMYTIQFVFDNTSTDIRRIRCTDNTIRLLAPDIFRAVQSSNKSRYLKQFTEKTIPQVYQCVPKHIIQANKKQFNMNVCETRTMTQEQTLAILHRMELHPRLVSFRQWIADHFYDDIPPAMEQDEEKEEDEGEKESAVVVYTEEDNDNSNNSIETFEEELKQEEMDKNSDAVIMSVADLTETLKREFLDKHLFFSYKDDVWTMAKQIAEFWNLKKHVHLLLLISMQMIDICFRIFQTIYKKKFKKITFRIVPLRMVVS